MKKAKKAHKKVRKVAAKTVKHEIVVRVDNTPVVPTVTDLAEPMRDGKKLTIPRTWMTDHQLTFMLQRTPKEQVYVRKGRGGQTFSYVTGSYMTKALNYAFGWNWDFEIVEHGKEADHVWVLGKLTVRGTKAGENISKTQFGRSDVKQLTNGKGNVDYGNDLKAAATDSLKKCASMLGFASDIYGKADYKAESGQDPRPAQEDYSNPGNVAAPKQEVEIQIGVPKVCQHSRGCGKDITNAEAEYSKRMYGRELCKEHFPKKR